MSPRLSLGATPRHGVKMKHSGSPLLSRAPTVHMRHPQPTLLMEHGLGEAGQNGKLQRQ